MNLQNEKNNIAYLRYNIFCLLNDIEYQVKNLSSSNLDQKINKLKITQTKLNTDLKVLLKKEEYVIEFLIKDIEDLYETNNTLKEEVERNGDAILRIHENLKSGPIV